jgi:4-diphosphocytidyl-2-C-methyl-D-erythritol kinase
MREIKLRANAKINLFLEVLDKRQDGYHNIETIFQSIDLHDTLSFREAKLSNIKLSCDNPQVPLDSSNLVYKAADLLLKESGKNYGCEVHITKRIPIGGGLAGGSADASATLIGLNKLWSLGYTFDDLLTFGGKLGADVPFCMIGGTALGTGRGDQLTKLNPFPKVYVVIANPGFQVSTAWAYKSLSSLGLTRERKSGNILIDRIQHSDLTDIGNHLFNVFELLVIQEYPIVGEIKTEMLRSNVLGAMMTGSGSTVFAITDSSQIANEVQKQVAEIVDYCIVAETSTNSISEI